MHFSIPDTQEFVDNNGASYTGYNIYINGSFHCCLRYKQLHSLHEQLRRYSLELNTVLPAFPPKRLLPLTNGQVETRRTSLEQYLQQIGQDSQFAKLDKLQEFLMKAQLETAIAEGVVENCSDYNREVSNFEVVLKSGYQLQVKCCITDSSSVVLQKVCQSLQLLPHLMPYFCLFLMRKQDEDTWILLRKLMDFEAPYLSRLQEPRCQIVLRKSYWNPIYDLDLIQDPNALNVLYMMTLGDMEREWVIAPPYVHQKLRSLMEHGFKKEYMELARKMPLYGCLQFPSAIVDFPDPNTPTLISIGNKEISMRTTKGAKIYETKFRVTRMRCWRFTALHNSYESKDSTTDLQLSFEYLMSKQTLRWVTIISKQAMLMSVCLRSMVDELLNSNELNDLSLKSDVLTTNSNVSPLAYVSRNGQVSQSTTLSSSSSSYSFSNEQSSTSTSTSPSSTASPTAPVKFLTQRLNKQNPKIVNSTNSYASVFFRNTTPESVNNEAFEGIGDDDL